MEQQVKSWETLAAEGWRKSSFSSNNGGNCVMIRPFSAEEGWRKSSFSSGNGGNCVMARSAAAGIAVGDTKDPGGAPLEFTAAQWAAFTASVKRAG